VLLRAAHKVRSVHNLVIKPEWVRLGACVGWIAVAGRNTALNLRLL
jgi:hypothetical protein